MTNAPASLALAAALLAATPAAAAETDLLIGLDSKVAYDANGQKNVEPGADALLIVDIADPAHPRIRASLPLTNSLLGPPTNLQITPNGRLALLANSVLNVQDGGAWKSAPDDKLYVVDLTATPPRLADTLTIGKQPSGLAISRIGDLVLVADRAGKGVSVLSIEGMTVRPVAEIPMGNDVAGVAIAPDGKRAFAVMNTVNKVAVLAIEGHTVTYDKAMDIPAAFNPYNIDVTPDGKYAVASSTGAGTNNGDALTVIEATGPHPHVVSLMSPGIGPEGFAIAPNGRFAVTPLLLGSGNKYADWSYTKNGEAVLLSVGEAGALTVANRMPLGALPEGVAWSPDSQYLYIANYLDRNLQVFRVVDGKLAAVGEAMALPGQPASMRGIAH